jgi:hypothetical protein
MNRLFHSRITWHAFLGTFITGFAALFLFWQRQGMSVLLGVVAVALTVVQVERIIHTTYTLTKDGWLVIYRGRFSRTRRIRVGDIWRMQKCSRFFGLIDYVLLEYGHHHYVVVMPENEGAFLWEVEKMQLQKPE